MRLDIFHPWILGRRGIVVTGSARRLSWCSRSVSVATIFGCHECLLARRAHSSVVRPHPSPQQSARFIPDHIIKPDYVTSGSQTSNKIISTLRARKALLRSPKIEIKTDLQIAGMKQSCQLARKVLNAVHAVITPGITTNELDRVAHAECVANDAYPSPLLYKGFPKSICTSVNNVACHGIPDDRALQDGDIVNVDVTVFYKGFHGDVSEMFLVGDVNKLARHLVNAAKLCRDKAITICRPGQKFNRIGKTISVVAKQSGCNVIPGFCGHGIGSYFHGPPDIIHFDNDLPGIMREGMTFTIEPVICIGQPDIEILEDGWTAVTKDNCLSAQFEHTILITAEGHEILTL